MHCSVKPISASVSREHAARAIGTMRSGSKSDDEQTNSGASKIGNGFSPVSFIFISPAFLLSDGLAVVDQAGTVRAVNDIGLKLLPARRY